MSMEHLTYELAKQLKEAGFPRGEGRYIAPPAKPLSTTDTGAKDVAPVFSDEIVYEPSLSSLIEACGDEFQRLHAYYQKLRKPTEWGAWSNVGAVGFGATPLEAVARLYLALHPVKEV